MAFGIGTRFSPRASTQVTAGRAGVTSLSSAISFTFAVADDGRQDLAAGGVCHGLAGGFDGVGDAAGGSVFDDVPARRVVPDVGLEVGALGGAVLLGVHTEDAAPEQRGAGVALEVDGLAQEPVDVLLQVLLGFLPADERGFRIVGLRPDLQ
ncbi:hypothetical protein ACWG5P_26400 [Streptomyces prasinus]